MLIKDHKKPNLNGTFPIRLVVPVTNLTGFPKLSYLVIKTILEHNNIKYRQHEIVQASHLTKQLKPLSINSSNPTIASLDVELMYLSIKYSLIEKDRVHYYTCDINDDDTMLQIDTWLSFIKFGLGATLLNFRDQYYLYNGDKEVETKRLTIGGYKSTWLG